MPVRAPIIEVALADLRPGLFVQLDLSWIDHPFASSSFLIKGCDQIAKLRELGLRHIKVDPSRSDADALAALAPPAAAEAVETTAVAVAVAVPVLPVEAPASPPATLAEQSRQRHRQLLSAQHSSLERSQKLHQKAVDGWMSLMREAPKSPAAAAEMATTLSDHLVDELQGSTDTTIRVLSEAAGTGSVQHAINVTVLSMMLARRVGLNTDELRQVALGALVHDIGKLMLPEALRRVTGTSSALATRATREHVTLGLRMGMSMGLPSLALRIIGQHHELIDGTGLPHGLVGDEICPAARVVAVADRYDRLCNPALGGVGRTPHEAQALLYAQWRHQLDPQVLSAFIKLIGVYPPGSVVQLSDGRFALVVSTHPEQPLKPCVLVHDANVPREEALLVDLLRAPSIGIRRSLHPQHLPRATLDYLAPAQRLHYYFAHELSPAPLEATA